MNEMNELFYQDAYMRAFRATVTSCQVGKSGFEVRLSQTAFYPEGGGQPADHGTIAEAIVTDVRRVGGEIIHYCDKALEVGAEVECQLDWDRRYAHMQNHTGEHIFSGLIYQRFGFANVGFHMDDNGMRCDFDGVMTDEEIAEMERAANDAIFSGIETQVLFPSPEALDAMQYRSKKALTGKVRIVDIADCDRCACCGTHVARSSEVGILKVLSAVKHRGGMRIEFLCGLRALADYEARMVQVKRISERLSAKQNEIADAVEKLLADSAAKDEKIAMRNQSLFTLKAQTLPAVSPLIVFEEGLTPFETKVFAGLLAEEKAVEVVAVLSEVAPETFHFVLIGPKEKMTQASRALNQELNGRGGGGNGLVQGSYKASKEAIETALRARF